MKKNEPLPKVFAKVYIGTSLDGFIARRDGDIDWLTQFANDEATADRRLPAIDY